MHYDMVFEGGGAKGMAFVGALQEVESRGHTPDRLMGASAGAIMATFLAAGYSSHEMLDALSEKKDGVPVFKGFLETPPPLTEAQVQQSAFRKLLRSTNAPLVLDALEEHLDDSVAAALGKSPLFNQLMFFFDFGGFYAGQYFLSWLKEKLNAGIYPVARGALKIGSPRCFGEMNLEQYYQATGVHLSLIASDTTDARLLVLNHLTAPGCPLVYAVRMSMSFPLLWNEVVWESGWGTYRGRDITGHTIVDGGMLSNFPIELFISDQPHITAVMGEKPAGKTQILGFLIDEAQDVPGAPPSLKGVGAIDKVLGGEVQLKTVLRIGQLINTVTQFHDKMVIDQYEQFVVRLPAKGYDTTEFDMTDERRVALVTAGRNAALQYFQGHMVEGSMGMGTDEFPSDFYPPDFYKKADHVAQNLLGS